MRVRVWDGPFQPRMEAVDEEGPPWIERKHNDFESAFVMLSLTGPAPRSAQVRVKFLEEEWPIIKARIDAAFAGEDPNQSKFYDKETHNS